MRRGIMSWMLLMSMLLVGCNQQIITENGPVEETMIETEKMIDEVDIEIERDPIAVYMEQMTLEEKVGQLFLVAFRQDAEGMPITTVTPEIQETLKEIPVGGVVLFKENVEAPEQVKAYIQGLQKATTIPLWIGVDEEGGQVSRIASQPGFTDQPFQSPFDMEQDMELAYNEARRMGKMLKDLGFNLDFAPSADIFNNPDNTVIGKRSFGVSQEEVTPMVIAMAEGLEAEGIMPVVKHFPGHGNTAEDSHTGLAYVNKTLEALEAEEIVPFQAAIEQEVPMLMVGHLIVPDVDSDYPATLSKKWGDYLAKMGTENILLITDAMEMGAISNNYSSAESSLKVIESGYDLILMPENLTESYEGILEACKEGVLTEKRIDKSVYKILSKKVEHNILVLE